MCVWLHRRQPPDAIEWSRNPRNKAEMQAKSGATGLAAASSADERI